MVHDRGCNPHQSLWRHWWRHNSETIRDREKRRPPPPWNPLSYPMVKTASLYDNFCKTGNDVIYDVIIWVQDGNCKKMAQENFSIGALYNITRNQHNPVTTVGRDSFLSPKTPINTSFLAVTQGPGPHSPYILGDTTRPRRITYVLVWSKADQRRLRKTLHKQTNKQTHRQTDKPTDTTKIMVTWPWTSRAGHYIFALWFLSSSFLLFSIA